MSDIGLSTLGLADDYNFVSPISTYEVDRKIMLLSYDIMRFELGVLEGTENWLPQIPADEAIITKRCARILKLIIPLLNRLGLQKQDEKESIIEYSKHLCEYIGTKIVTSKEKFILQVSNIPVYTVHDEYMFIRVLQIFECTFSWIVSNIQYILKTDNSNIDIVVATIDEVSNKLKEVSSFFTLLSTMRPKAFQMFRAYTEGASAIQSRNYKMMESLCRKPDKDRLDSIAYHSVPEVRGRILQEQATLEEKYEQIVRSDIVSTENKLRLKNSLEHFEVCFQSWKQTHYAIAVNMLGNSKAGTGYTAGVPYLKEVKDIPIFNLNKRNTTNE